MGDQLRIGILCGREAGSPRVLGETLARFVEDAGHEAHLRYRVKAATRLVDAAEARVPGWAWGAYRLLHRRGDARLFADLAEMDAVVVCGTTPNAFRRGRLDIPGLKARIRQRPVLYYAVQFLGNAPSLVRRLEEGGHDLLERFDWHLAVSAVTERRGRPAPPWDAIGLYLASTGLAPTRKDPFLAVVDFARPGYERYRSEQIAVLRSLDVPYVALDRPYSMTAIRDIYRRAAVFFIQFPESFGMPIAECLATGAHIATPDPAWPMAWRTDEAPEPHRPGTLPGCFLVYHGADDLTRKIRALRESHDPEATPRRVFDVFRSTYPTFYDGNPRALHAVLDRIRAGELRPSTNRRSAAGR